MEKKEFIKVLKDFRASVLRQEQECRKVSGIQIQSKSLLNGLESIATNWFDVIESELRTKYLFCDETINKYREKISKILELSGGRPSKRVVMTILDAILLNFNTDVLVAVQIHQDISRTFSGQNQILNSAIGIEIGLLTEAIECIRLSQKRAAIILGWCATVNRLHLFVEKEGFQKFNMASIKMCNLTTGRYKRFSTKYDIQNLSDLRMTVFDGNLLWVLEFMGSIDGNQHERLEICFTMRNTCAHPGETTISDENLLSFFSDIQNIVFNNQRFSLK